MAAAPGAALSRVAVRYDTTQKDLVLPSSVPIGEFITDVIDALAEDADIESPRDGHWTLARMDGAIKPDQTLNDARVLDGALLELRAVASTERYRPVIEDVVDAVSEAAAQAARPFDADAARRAGLAGLAAGGLALCAGQWALWWANGFSWIWMAVGLVGAASALIGMTSAALRYRSADASTAWAVVWLVAAAAVGQVVPVSERTVVPGVAHLLISAVGIGIAALCALLITRRHLAAYSSVIAMAAAAALTCVVVEYTDLAPSAIAAGAVLVGLIGLLQVPRTALGLARITLPPVLAPGQEDIEVGSGVDADELETLRLRAQRAVQLTSGLMVATVALVSVAAAVVFDPNSYYVRQMIGIVVCVVLVLVIRGRTMPNQIQAYAMFGGAVAVIVAVAARAVFAWPSGVAPIVVMVVVAAVTVGLSVIAIVVPGRSVNPRVSRWVQWLGNAALGVAFPLCFWVMGVYATLRDLSLG
ncbi:type VII secretion integral membrane protein EccD [Mycolicibacterium iranicum]|uniref:Type VII secretion integral membrane protein EccD n=1 Tax=Mycolicibacterium iranicum TaxID=912594 RepID=A0ABT4HKI8_MYCIR|nr:type VII secretion integral membrane protein EccD [Mycolicibacterium iranicum]MCZ0730703.1 type VII secretion integral membrane protein EccD [Mycolicibacterium iranicum]